MTRTLEQIRSAPGNRALSFHEAGARVECMFDEGIR